MLSFKEKSKKILLYETCSPYVFSEQEIQHFTECCKHGRSVLLEKQVDIQAEIDKTILEYLKKIKNFDVMTFEKDLTFILFANNIKFVIYPEPSDQYTIPVGYNPYTNDIYIFITTWKELTSDATILSLRHEIKHYFDLKDLPLAERLKHLSNKFKNKEAYYTDEYEFNAYKETFIAAAYSILSNTLQSEYLEKDIKKIPKKDVYELFDFVADGKLDLYGKWFLSLSNIQKKDVLDSMLKRFSESFKAGGSLNLRENTILYLYYKNKK